VAVPTNQLQLTNDKLTLRGASQDALRSMPPFEYKRK